MDIADEVSWREHLADLIYMVIPPGEPKTRNRTQINFRCPFCGDSKKSFTKKRGFYYIPNESYHCFNCEINTSGLKLLKQMAPESVYSDALREFKAFRIRNLASSGSFRRQEEAEDIDRSLIQCRPIPAWKHLLDDPDKWEHPSALTPEQILYLEKRGVADKAFNFLSIRNKKDNIPFILIPWEYAGQCIFYQLHNYTGAEKYPKYLFPHSIDLNDQEKPVFNIDVVDPSWKYIIACEGVYDALSYKNGVSLGGRVLTEYQGKLLKERWPHHQIVAAFDNDQDGRKSMIKMCKDGRSSAKFLDIFPVFEHCKVKDANEFIQLGEKANSVLQDKKFLEKCMKSPFEMQVGLLLG